MYIKQATILTNILNTSLAIDNGFSVLPNEKDDENLGLNTSKFRRWEIHSDVRGKEKDETG